MQEGTKIRNAVRLASLAICEYHSRLHNIALKPLWTKAEWVVGRGWFINGVLYPGTSEQVIAHFDRMQRKWHQKSLDYEAGLAAATAKIATPGEANP
jgi:hypothetical protein